MPAILPITSSRVSDQLLQRRLLSQFEFDRVELLRLQDSLSTGIRISMPSDDAPAGLRAITLQRLLEEKQQLRTNLDTSKTYLAATDNALSSVSDVIAEIRAEALTIVDSTASDTQRQVMVQQVEQAIEHLVNVGNRTFRGRYLFAGSATTVRPFDIDESHVAYRGNESNLQSFVDLDLLFDTNSTGDEVFGAISPEVRGAADLNPIVTPQTRLADLRGGRGIDRGSFLVSDGYSTRTIDVSTAETVGDVVRLIEANPPLGRQVTARLNGSGLVIDIDDAGGGNLTIREVSGGTTALELGILDPTGVGVGQIVGADRNPRLRPTTQLADILGTRATAALTFAGNHNDIAIEAANNGSQFNGIDVQFTGGAAGDTASVNYDSVANTLTIDVSPGVTTAATVVQAIDAHGLFTARLDEQLDPDSDGSGLVDVTFTTQTEGGSGIVLDRQSGIRVVNGGRTHTITFEDAETVEDLLNALNGSGADVVAAINRAGTGIDVRSRLSGTDFHIGENGGTTAAELGIRTFTRDTLLTDLNYGRGIDTADGTDFVVRRKDGVELEIDVSDAQTVGDVIDLINGDSANQDPATRTVARLAEVGNGLELVDSNLAAAGVVTVSRANSFAAWDLGFVPRGDDSAAAPSGPATASIAFGPPDDLNTAMLLTAVDDGPVGNGVNVEILDSGAVTGDDAVVSFDAGTNQLLVDVDLGTTTAATVVDRINGAGVPFTAELDCSGDAGNDGSGLVLARSVTSNGGFEDMFRSADVNPLETKGVFSSLQRLADAIEHFDLVQIERAVAMLGDDFNRLNFARAEVGSRERTFDALKRRLENEEVELRATLSEEIDTDIVQAISDLSARQANFEATLRLIGRTMQLSVLDFI